MRERIYHRIRDLVINEATRHQCTHQANQELVHQNLESLCRAFDPRIPVDDFWCECWSHFRWAGIKAVIGTADVEAHKKVGVFDDFRELSSPDWNFPEKIPRKKAIDGWGERATAYLRGEPPFNIKGFVKHRHKLKKSVQVARGLLAAVEKFGPDEYLRGIFGDDFYNELENEDLDTILRWIRSYCGLMSGDNTITAFHLMTDLGFNCVKPDIILTDIFYRLGWLAEAGLPDGMTTPEVKKHYRSKRVYIPLQQVARQLAREITPLYPVNAIRELDWVMVKYGQEPEPGKGIVRKLDDERPVQSIREEIENQEEE